MILAFSPVVIAALLAFAFDSWKEKLPLPDAYEDGVSPDFRRFLLFNELIISVIAEMVSNVFCWLIGTHLWLLRLALVLVLLKMPLVKDKSKLFASPMSAKFGATALATDSPTRPSWRATGARAGTSDSGSGVRTRLANGDASSAGGLGAGTGAGSLAKNPPLGFRIWATDGVVPWLLDFRKRLDEWRIDACLFSVFSSAYS